MALIVAMGPPKKGNKMKKKEEVMLEDESDMMSDMDEMEDESEYDDLEDEDLMDSEDEDMLFGEDSEDADLEMLVEDVLAAFESKDAKQLMMALKDFIRSVMDKE
jgi:hypothetical protein